VLITYSIDSDAYKMNTEGQRNHTIHPRRPRPTPHHHLVSTTVPGNCPCHATGRSGPPTHRTHLPRAAPQHNCYETLGRLALCYPPLLIIRLLYLCKSANERLRPSQLQRAATDQYLMSQQSTTLHTEKWTGRL
jgi:hypothetical protein